MAKTGMNRDIVEQANPNFKIMGMDFYAEEINPDVSYNHREINQNPILGGTVHVTRGKYVVKKVSIVSTIYHPENHPEVYDKIFEEMMSKPVEVISPYMGGKFMANVIVNTNPLPASPNHIEVSIDIEEIPEVNSNIPGESKFIVPKTTKADTAKKTDPKLVKQNKEINQTLKKCRVPFKKNQLNVCVRLLQEKLILLGYLDKRFKNGRYDSNTINAVKKFQRANGKLLVDGVFGPYTLKHILNANDIVSKK